MKVRVLEEISHSVRVAVDGEKVWIDAAALTDDRAGIRPSHIGNVQERIERRRYWKQEKNQHGKFDITPTLAYQITP